ncbi:hypothetical protein NC652_007514 [Populus alba x Populus x berolinensis]|nr:hypothetical protein NC652_007514 [Populus alba x Populus x berolinensis]
MDEQKNQRETGEKTRRTNTERKARKPKNTQKENMGSRKITRKHRKKKKEQHRENRETERRIQRENRRPEKVKNKKKQRRELLFDQQRHAFIAIVFDFVISDQVSSTFPSP